MLETERLVLRPLTPDDAGFILDLLNQPSFLRHIGDKGVRTTEDAREYIRTGPAKSYEEHRLGLFLVELKEPAVPMGICGLLKREAFEDVDLGFAFLPAFWSQGYALESARAVLGYGKDVLGLARVVAYTSADNASSIQLLEKLGFRFERVMRWPEDGAELKLFAIAP